MLAHQDYESDENYEYESDDSDWTPEPDNDIVIALHKEVTIKPQNQAQLDEFEKQLRLIYRKALYGGQQIAKRNMQVHASIYEMSNGDFGYSFMYRTIRKVLITENVPPDANSTDWSQYFDSSNRKQVFTSSGALLRLGVHRNLWKQIMLFQYDKRRAFNAVLKACSYVDRMWLQPLNANTSIRLPWGDALFNEI